MKRILSLDGGGLRGFFSLQVLRRIEALVRERRGDETLVLADHFDLFAGTSTGAIIATMLCWGLSVDQIEGLYRDEARNIFRKSGMWDMTRAWYTDREISKFLVRFFSEDGKGAKPATLGTSRLKKLLLIVMRDASTGSVWPVTNNPSAKYNRPDHPECNLKLPLWKLVRASTAAPLYFPPQEIRIGKRRHVFLDGGVTPHNNPAVIAFLMATQAPYAIGWPTGVDKLQLVSVGTGSVATRIAPKQSAAINMIDQAVYLVPALLQTVAAGQDLVCRSIGACLWAEPFDSEIGRLLHAPRDGSDKLFSYVRYDHRFSPSELRREFGTARMDLPMARVDLIEKFQSCGARFAEVSVKPEHLLL